MEKQDEFTHVVEGMIYPKVSLPYLQEIGLVFSLHTSGRGT